MVLDGVVSATVEHLGYVRPLVLVRAMHQEQDPFLLTAPVDLFDPRIQMVVPAFATLLSHAARQAVCDACPPTRTQFSHELEHLGILFLCPGPLYYLGFTTGKLLLRIISSKGAVCTYIVTS